MAGTERGSDRRRRDEKWQTCSVAETSKELAECRWFQRKNLSILNLLKRKGWPQCQRESNCQVRQSLPCQKEKEQSLLSRAPDRKGAFSVRELKRAAAKETEKDEYSSAEGQ